MTLRLANRRKVLESEIVEKHPLSDTQFAIKSECFIQLINSLLAFLVNYIGIDLCHRDILVS